MMTRPEASPALAPTEPSAEDAAPGGRPDSTRILAVVPANCRFPNMALNHRLRALIEVGRVDILSCYPASFPPDVRDRAAVRRLPVSPRLRSATWKVPAFTLEAAVWAAAARFRGRRYRLIYCGQDTSAVAGLILRRGSGWVVDALDDPAQELSNARERGDRLKAMTLRLRDRLFRSLVRRADAVLTIGSRATDPLPEIMRSDYRVSAERIVPLNQAVDVAAVRRAVERGPGLVAPRPGSTPSAVFVGFVSPLRGVDTLLAAADILSVRGVRFELCLVGHLKEPDRAWLASWLRGHPGLARYLGVLAGPETLAQMSRGWIGILPFPMRRETAPVQAVTGIEYLALGKPLVATDLPGARELVEDGVNGYLVPPVDPTRMADAIGRLLADPALVEAMGRRSWERAERFDVRDVNRRMRSVLEPWL